MVALVIPARTALGGRRIALGPRVVMTGATVVFAFAPNVEALVAARFLQGIASGTGWTASMAWALNAPPNQRGRESGIVMGLLSAGSIAGPRRRRARRRPRARRSAFLSRRRGDAARLRRDLAPRSGRRAGGAAPRRRARRGRRRPLRASGARDVGDRHARVRTVDLLVPLDLGDLGAPTTMIALALTAGALLGAIVGPPGRPPRRPRRAGSVGFASALRSRRPRSRSRSGCRWGQLAVLVLVGPVFAVAAAAIYPLASPGADRAGVAHVAVNGVLGASWAAGFAVAPIAASLVADATSQAVAFGAAACLCVPLLWIIARDGRGATVAVGG